ncbi:kinesin motor protein, partial [Reticulomyxa filosa]
NQVGIIVPKTRGRDGHRLYTYDMVFDNSANQQMLFESAIEPIICDVLSGYNCTVFAYGQTGSGKTFTMEGDRFLSAETAHAEHSSGGVNNSNDGIIPRAIGAIFERLKDEKIESAVSVSHLEIYNEELRDLLATDETSKKLILLKDDSAKHCSRKNGSGLFVRGLEEVLVKCPQDIFNILFKRLQKKKKKKRTYNTQHIFFIALPYLRVASTNLNERSSRSHCIFTIVIRMREVMETEDLVKTGTLNLVDLAGSESIARSGAIDQRAVEAGHINTKSIYIYFYLFVMELSINNSIYQIKKNLLIATVSPESSLDESLSTLDYALRAKNIQNKPEVNVAMTQKTYVKELQATLNDYKRQIEALRNEKGIILPTEQFESMETTISCQKNEIDNLNALIEHKTKELTQMSSLFAKQNDEIGHLQTLQRQLQ